MFVTETCCYAVSREMRLASAMRLLGASAMRLLGAFSELATRGLSYLVDPASGDMLR